MLILIPNLLTAFSFSLGLYSMILLWRGEDAAVSCWIIFACALLDGLDGPLARKLNAVSSFGRFFDSVADFVSFGLAPVFIGGALVLDRGILFLTASGIYLFACLFRLIRFHLLSGRNPAGFFWGLPITASACLFAAAILIFQTRVSALWLISLYFFLAFLMASRIPVPRLRF
jgi:CDP-diacylglycerol---serine O-phosphatidyltransferase